MAPARFSGRFCCPTIPPAKVVCIAIAAAKVEIPHQPRWRVPQVQGDRVIARRLHIRGGSAIGAIDGVALGGQRKIDGQLGEGERSFRQAKKMDGLLRGDRQTERVWIGQTNVFRREADESTGDVERVVAALQHAGQPVQRRVRV